jgi:hypothetical protein
MITKLKGAVTTKATEEKKAKKAQKARPRVASEKGAPEKPAAKPKPRVSGFVGTATMVDANLIQVKGKKEAITFDASNPELKGYTAIGDVMVGDTVAAEYTKDGIMITKLKGAVTTKATEEKKAKKAQKAPREKVAAGDKKVEKAKEAPTEEVVSRINCTGTGPCTVSVVRLTKGRAVNVGDYKLNIINISRQGGSGTVYSTPTGIFCSTGSPTGCEDRFLHGEEVTLSAWADGGCTFNGWRPTSLCPGTGDCIVPMDKKRTVKAVFTFSGP